MGQVLRGLVVSSGELKYKDFKLFSYSGLKGQTRVSKTGLHVNSKKVTLVITSPDKGFLDFVLVQVFKQPHLFIDQLQIVPEHVDEERLLPFENKMRFICISPLVLLEPTFNADPGKRFIEPSTDEFSDLMFEHTMERMEESGIDTSKISEIDKFQVVPDLSYIQKLRDSKKKFARIYPMYHDDVKYEVRGYTFPFVLYAPVPVQEFIFICGLGRFCSKGFGMLDLANSDPVERISPYEFEHLLPH
ncbi:MAG: CRISPR-associated endoribonuclease Cas6 [Cyclobacteriaceae bacterium]